VGTNNMNEMGGGLMSGMGMSSPLGLGMMSPAGTMGMMGMMQPHMGMSGMMDPMAAMHHMQQAENRGIRIHANLSPSRPPL
jgi:hypothetical protein